MSSVTRRRSRQFVSLVGANALSAATNLAIVWFLTKALTPTTFGEYRYTVVFFAFMATICQLGIPYAASVLLTREDDDERSRKIITVTAEVMIAVSAVATVAVIAVLWLVRALGGNLPPVLLASAPFLVVGILQAAWIEMLKGANRIADIAAQTLVPYLLILGGSVAAWLMLGRGFPYPVMLGIHVAAYALIHVVTFARLGRRAGEERTAMRADLMAAEKSMGWHVYVGSVVAVATANFLSLLVGRVVGMETYATYALALTMAMPAQMVPSVMGVVMFRENATADRLSRRSIQATVGVAVLFVTAYLLALWLLFPLLFSEHYLRAVRYCWALVPAYAVFGLGDYVNRFIGAKGAARYLKMGAIGSGLANLAVTCSLIALWREWAAVLGVCLAALTYLGAMMWAYRRVVRAGDEGNQA